MTPLLQRPLVVGSVTLAFSLGLLELINQTAGEWGVYSLVAVVVSAGVWWFDRQSKQRQVDAFLPRYVDSAIVKQTLTEAERVIDQLSVEGEDAATVQPQVSLLQAQVSQITNELDRESLRLLVMGAKGCGKTSLIQHLQSWQAETLQAVTLYEAPSFSLDGELAADTIALKQAQSADLVLFLVTGDLTESELQTLKQLALRQRTLLVFNKQDQYLPDERAILLSRMQNWGRDLLPAADVIAIASAPRSLKVRQHQPNGSVVEWLEDQQPDIYPLTQRLDAILKTESQQLVLASSLNTARAIRAQAATALNDVRRIRALPIVEKFQWISAGTAFASPIPTVDVLATAAINVQMILDLGKIYQQKFSLDQAQKIVTTLGGLILKLGLVELSTRAIAALLKTNVITYVAGGCIQAISAAYLTRIAGLTLIEYFHTQEPNLSLAEAKPLAIEQLGQVLQQVFHQNQATAILPTLAGQVIDRLSPKPAVAPLATPVPTIAAPPDLNVELLQPVPLKLPEPAIAETLPPHPQPLTH